jgi:hypothetical protein
MKRPISIGRRLGNLPHKILLPLSTPIRASISNANNRVSEPHDTARLPLTALLPEGFF